MDKRTQQQNNALHLYISQVSRECRERGITLKMVLETIAKEGIYPSERSLKTIVQGIADVMFNKEHTRTLTKDEMQDVINQFIVVLSKVGVETPFPNKEDLEYYERNKTN